MANTLRNNPVRGPLNAFILNMVDGYAHHLFGKSKKQLFKGHPNEIVEIGPGTGANMRYLQRGTTVIAVEPNKHMHKRLEKQARKYGIHLEIKSLQGEQIDLPDHSYEMVICTLVLCTVQDPTACLNEVKRILKPGGKFVFIEHVAAKRGSFMSSLQRMVHGPWFWFFEGCSVCRDTKSLLSKVGFSKLQLDEYNLYSAFIPITPQIRGVAIK